MIDEILAALRKREENGGVHLHHSACIHNLPPAEQVTLRGKTVEWWQQVIGPLPEQITPEQWETTPPEFGPALSGEDTLMPDPTLADLAGQYRERATSLGQHAADAEAQPERKAYHAGLAQHCRFVAADWTALAALVEFAAPRTTGRADELLAIAAKRLAERLEDIHGR